MNSPIKDNIMYTPDQVSQMLQVSTNTVYSLINKGDIIAKKLGRVYRIPRSSIFFVFSGMDYDIYQKEKEDKKNIDKIQSELSLVRKSL
ncbi:helix-turn-helix domain-containing protein [Patescibacteria group bacterium]|nr:helix-turn-helix domain-containing protein [Patescibacteria group bacterium]